MSPLERRIVWQLSGDRKAPYRAQVDGQSWRIRVNDFPRVRYLFTLLVDDREVEEFTDWPAVWERPPLPGTAAGPAPPPATEVDLNQKDEYEDAVEKFERTKHIKPSKRVK